MRMLPILAMLAACSGGGGPGGRTSVLDTADRGYPDPDQRLPPVCTPRNCWTSEPGTGSFTARWLVPTKDAGLVGAGEFYTTMSMGGVELGDDNFNGPDGYLYEVNADGEFVSLLNMGSTFIYDIVAVPDGDAVMACHGLFDEVLDGSVVDYIENTLVRFDRKTGEIKWYAEGGGGPGITYDVDEAGVIWGTHSVATSLAFGEQTIATDGRSGRFSVSTDGVAEDWQPLSDGGVWLSRSLPDGSVLVAGSGGTSTVGDTTLEGKPTDSFVAALDADGHMKWAHLYGSETAQVWSFYSARVHDDGAVTLEGNFRGGPGTTMILPDGSIVPTPSWDNQVLTQIEADGSYGWSVQVPSGYLGIPFGIQEGPEGMLYHGGREAMSVVHPDGALYGVMDGVRDIGATAQLPDGGFAVFGHSNVSEQLTITAIWPPR